MEDSAYQALYTGVYVFIFVIAISSTIYLFVTMLNYSDLAYEYGRNVVNGNIIENISDSRYRLLTGSDVLTYYFNYTKNDKYESYEDTQYNITILDNNGSEIKEGTYGTLKDKIDYDAYYKIVYESVDKNGVVNLKISKYE